MEVGFSGTRKGMTYEQAAAVTRLLSRIKDFNPTEECWLNHGDCVGADYEVHHIAKELGYKIRLHPPENFRSRAYCEVADEIMPPAIYSVRNGNIVRTSKLVIAAPSSKSEQYRGSGTWQVIRMCQKARRPNQPYVTVFPDGVTEGQHGWQQFIH